MQRNGQQAVLFDLDGLLVDSEPLWKRAEERLLAAFGREFRHEVALEMMGMRMADCAKAMLGAYAIEGVDPAAFARKLVDAFLAEVDGGLRSMPGAERALDMAAKAGQVAIASSSPIAVIDRVVVHFGWGAKLAARCSGDEVAAGKPAPDIFLEAARRLATTTDRCTVIEDSLNGARAAKAAGMRCIAVPGPDFDPSAFAPHVDLVLDSLERLEAADLGLRDEGAGAAAPPAGRQ